MALSLPPFLRCGPKYQAVMSLGPAQALTFPLRTEWLGPALVGSPGVRKAGAGESGSGMEIVHLLVLLNFEWDEHIMCSTINQLN